MNKNKKFKLLKRILALYVVVMLNINTYAAVGANDGSAFVTKSEFDALVNTFNAQMDVYENGIIGKIDGAVANYLNSLSNSKTLTLTNYIENLEFRDRNFMNMSNVTYTVTGNTWQLQSGTNAVISKYKQSSSKVGYVRVDSFSKSNTSLSLKTSDDRDSDFKLMYDEYEKDGTTYYYVSKVRDSIKYKVTHIIKCTGSSAGWGELAYAGPPTATTWTANSTVKIPGENNSSFWIGGEGLLCITSHTIKLNNYTNGGTYLRYNPGSSFSTTKDYATHYGIVYGKRSEFESDSQEDITQQGDSAGCEWVDYTTGTVRQRGGDKFNYTFYTQKIISLNPTEWINYSATEAYNDIVYKINGLPLTKINKNTAAGTLKIPLKITCATGKCTVVVRNTKFDNSDLPTKKGDNDLYWNDNVGSASGESIEIIIPTPDKETEDKTYWIKINPNSTGTLAQIDANGDITLTIED